ncbi:MAG TPA: S53 family peptidase [Mycobacteriales bacterium]|jgi:subtilase family serine protease|nr:S53 family peptidase [Mycobacteriales bacterium]
MVNRSWWQGRAATVSWLVALLAGLLVAAAYPAAAASSGGSKTPSIAVAPHYKVAGKANPGVPPTFTCQTQPSGQCFGPAQIRAAYGIDKVNATGAGRSIVIVDAFQSPTIQHDLDLFDSVFELPAATVNIVAPDGLTPFDQADANQTGWAGEISLDVEWAHAVAPAAKITLVLSKTNDDADILSATKFAVDHNLGDVISQSFGEDERCVDPAIAAQQHRVFQAATLKGITLLASSGDQGAAQPTCDGSTFSKAVSSPATDPLVTAVGGTLLDADGITGAYHSETTWNEPDFEAGGGGGFSTLTPTPIFQKQLHLPSRGVPDVSYNAGINTGVLAVWSTSGQGADLLFIFGGTSAGSPQWAGLVALSAQLRHARVGWLNPQLYALSLVKPVYNALFHDITTGDNTFHGEAFGDPTIPGFAAKKGWDAATGLGTPKANTIVPVLGGKLP